MSIIQDLDPDFLRARQSAKWSSFDAPVLPSNPAEMDFAVAPAIQAAMERVVSQQKYGYSTRGPGSPGALLAESFCRRMLDKFGWDGADPARVVVVNDLIQAVMSSVLAFSEPGDGVALQVPSYPAFLGIIAQSGRQTVCNPMRDTGERYEIDAEQFQDAVDEKTRVLLLCLPQNPTGRVFPRDELAPVVERAVAMDMVIVADEIHADLLLDGRRHIPFARMFPEAADRTITLYSATKSFNIPGLRTAVMHFGSDELLRRFHSRIPPMLLGTPASPGTFATLAAWEESEAWCQALIKVLEANRDHMLSRLAEELPTVRMYTPEATYLAWADFTDVRMNAVPYERLLAEAKVAGGDGRNFGPHYERFVRLNFSTSRSVLDEKLDRIARAVKIGAV
ncbi:MalY/PatB family protein [Mesorhizobium australicum]|uniref:cysteine-S-conjugate beta-lyase n=1 Tax=Mesorhizobium australicum TaxID=536018 RepID=A0A1X7PPS4_9HYPH|nr:aminotransferase class I/II-fold pyridoxal phosphate-dependent enzyme [Mesorhizobium australicum]SMH53948.1 cystathione beta-lyase [Mesorhizobium australicum]